MILYLSATGNTLWAAEQLAQATGERLLPFTQAKDQQLEQDERLGLLFPVHGWRPPRLVRDFIDRMPIEGLSPNTYIYALCTAGDNTGETIPILYKHLQARGLRLNAAFSLIMPNTYVGLPFMDIDSAETTLRKKADAKAALQTIIPHIVNRDNVSGDLHEGRWPRTDSRLLGEAFERWIITDRPFRVDQSRCVKCGICADVCPVGDIRGGLGYQPQWKHDGRCLTCFSCFHHCPHHAIEYGNRTGRKGQYFYNKRIK